MKSLLQVIKEGSLGKVDKKYNANIYVDGHELVVNESTVAKIYDDGTLCFPDDITKWKLSKQSYIDLCKAIRNEFVRTHDSYYYGDASDMEILIGDDKNPIYSEWNDNK